MEKEKIENYLNHLVDLYQSRKLNSGLLLEYPRYVKILHRSAFLELNKLKEYRCLQPNSYQYGYVSYSSLFLSTLSGAKKNSRESAIKSDDSESIFITLCNYTHIYVCGVLPNSKKSASFIPNINYVDHFKNPASIASIKAIKALFDSIGLQRAFKSDLDKPIPNQIIEICSHFYKEDDLFRGYFCWDG